MSGLTRFFLTICVVLGLAPGCAGQTEIVRGDGDPAPAKEQPKASTDGARAAQEREAADAADQGAQTKVWTPRLDSPEAYLRYSDQVASERFSKFLINLKTNEIWYFDVNIFPMHADFVFGALLKTDPTPEALAELIANYEEEKPSYIFGYLAHHLLQDEWTFAFWEGDRMTPKHVELAYQKLRGTFFAGDRVKFRPDSPHHTAVSKLVKGVPVITNEQIYAQSSYQIFTEGERVGRLRVIDDIDDSLLSKLSFAADEILVLNEAIPYLTVVSGVISQQFSTPLSHVALRAKAWGIPHAGVLDAANLFRHLDGHIVYFQARADGYTVRDATPEEVAKWESGKAKVERVTLPEPDLAEKRLLSLSELRKDRVRAFGAKSANLGEMVSLKVEGANVPPGFGIPISYYAEHMRRSGLDQRVRKMLEDTRFREDAEYRWRELESLRKAIAGAPLDKKLLTAVEKRIRELGFSKRGAFVRSSTNAEDLPGFNGAGLYDTIPNVRGREAMADAIRAVWASVWNVRGYEEREHFGIDHNQVYGAILVQQGVDATAAGVLVTTNIYDTRPNTIYTINAKSGLGIRVVDGRKMPEQILYNTKTGRMRVLSRSDEGTMLVFDDHGGVKEVPAPALGTPVLTESRVKTLGTVCERLVAIFPEATALDIEWLFQGETLHIVQARPYVTQ
ncbi:MAG: PEP/pyruvate-binding domain-containing protein [Myxococcota bacterium]